MIADLLATLAKPLVRLRYKIELKGTLPENGGGILFLPNHPALIDPVILRLWLQKPWAPHVLADKDRISGGLTGWAARQMKALPLPDPAVYGASARDEVEKALETCAEVLNQGENLLLYPAGRIYRSHLEDLRAASAVEAILQKAPKTRIVLIRTTGLWGSRASRIHGTNPQMGAFLAFGLKKLIANLFFFMPRRPVTLTFHEPPDFPREADKLTQNRFMEAFYNQEAPAGRYIPYGFWELSTGRDLPDPVPPRAQGTPDKVQGETRTKVLEHLQELSGQSDLGEDRTLARDLGLDSLGRLEILTWLSQEFGIDASDPEALQSVGDVLLAAAGLLDTSGQGSLKPIDERWFAPHRAPAQVPEGQKLLEVFLAQARRQPDAVILADQISGVKSYRDIILGILALKPSLEAMDGPYVGIMLPASAVAGILYLAVLAAGKTPVMVNWTVGGRSLRHGLDLLKVTRILTSGQLVAKLDAQGLDLSSIQEHFLPLEELGKGISTSRKLWALAQSRLNWSAIRPSAAPEVAAVLFTSGSESLPKAVPLTQANLLANIRDMVESFPIINHARFMGILPPFHVFGLTCTTLQPLLSGVPVVFHPNPTEGGALAALIEAYGASFLLGTPTFLSGILRAARDEQLAGLRYVVSGAEKCPDSLYEALAQRCPQLAVMEGYGITECSPVVSANRYEDRRCGTIGQPMPSVKWVRVDPDSGGRCAPDKPGLLLVKGPSIFSGYLHYEGPSPFQDFEGSLWYRTGDLVKEEGGHLVFAGRLKRFVKLGGEMVSLPAIEETLLARFGSPDDEEIILAVEATPDELNPELVLFTIREITREAANTAIREAGLSPIHHLRRVQKLEHLPVLGTGKTDYRALKEKLT
nr:AMP-binding protein [uncultured Holophaga sp.]